MTVSGNKEVLWEIYSENELEKWGAEFKKLISSGNTVLIKGNMGSGKTTLVRALLRALNGNEATSPTFSIANEYEYPGGMVYHFDLYRIEEPEELEEIGFQEYLDRHALCFIEWPEIGRSFYDEKLTSTLIIEVLPDSGRIIKWIKGIEI